jgi:hypothetical protein
MTTLASAVVGTKVRVLGTSYQAIVVISHATLPVEVAATTRVRPRPWPS